MIPWVSHKSTDGSVTNSSSALALDYFNFIVNDQIKAMVTAILMVFCIFIYAERWSAQFMFF
jgi:hypothetical protein